MNNSILAYSQEEIKETYQCQYCGKFITDEEGTTCYGGEWVCDCDICRTLDDENEGYIRKED
jgi:hypothetical protein